MQDPRTPHLEAAKRILRYIKGLVDYGLMYEKGNDFVLQGFADADWADNTAGHRSTSVYCFNLGFAVVSWCSKKNSTITLSNTKMEYIAVAMETQECIWLKCLMGDIFGKVENSVQIQCDNESAIKLASNSVFHGGTKHIEVRHHFIREAVLNQ